MRNYTITQDRNNFFREQILLFLPWRNEDGELEEVNYSSKYAANFETIKTNSGSVISLPDDGLQEALKEAQKGI